MAREKINITSTREGDTHRIRYQGPLNEDASIELLALYSGSGKTCIFDFAGLSSINSKGISAWMSFIRGFAAQREISFINCPPPLVLQVNMIPSFVAKVRVESVYCPYACEACGERTLHLVTLPQQILAIDLTLTPPITCIKCGGQARPEDDPADYFAFLEQTA